MARPKKESKTINLNIERNIYDKFVEFCNSTGLTKTVVTERAIEMYIDTMNENPEKLIQNKTRILKNK